MKRLVVYLIVFAASLCCIAASETDLPKKPTVTELSAKKLICLPFNFRNADLPDMVKFLNATWHFYGKEPELDKIRIQEGTHIPNATFSIDIPEGNLFDAVHDVAKKAGLEAYFGDSEVVLREITITAVQSDIRLSVLAERNETKRRKAFTEWVTEKTAQEEYERYEKKGQFTIYHESSEFGERRIYEDTPDGFSYQIWTLYGDEAFIGKDKELRDHYVLLTASAYTNQEGHILYRGIWVSKDIEERMQRVIRRYGISQAVIASADEE